MGGPAARVERATLESFAELAADPSFRDFVCLYIAEGYERSRHTASICNSDPAVMKVATQWLRRLTDRPLSYSNQHHADQDVSELCSFWSELLKTDASAMRLHRKSNSGRLQGRRWRSRHGVLAVSTHDNAAPRSTAGVDRLSEARMVPRTGLDSTASGRSEAWYRAAFGEPRPPVRIRAPRLEACWLREGAGRSPNPKERLWDQGFERPPTECSQGRVGRISGTTAHATAHAKRRGRLATRAFDRAHGRPAGSPAWRSSRTAA
jgi:hypothetical protein